MTNVSQAPGRNPHFDPTEGLETVWLGGSPQERRGKRCRDNKSHKVTVGRTGRGGYGKQNGRTHATRNRSGTTTNKK
eukprot:12923434-Prorocentrum_lima.AAC.1